jgi:fibro-slime domain-containing protein
VRKLAAIAVLALSPALALACGSSKNGSGFDNGGDGDGGGSGEAGSTLGGDGGPNLGGDGSGGNTDAGDGACGPNLTGVLRDFHDTHPDFEKFLGDDRGIVKTDLGADFKPVYASATTTPTTTGKANFDQWYRDVPGINVSQLFTVPMTQLANGVSSYDNPAFFPLDNQGFGNEGRDHNFHFTFELHTEFIYKGGEVFTFIGDDDVFTFITGKLAIDLGGVHGAETQSVDLDANAATLGIAKGNTYPLDVFQAERHTTESHFRIDTSIQFTNCSPILH